MTTDRFARDVDQAVNEVRSALRGLVNALPGPPRSAKDLGRRLGLKDKLSWQIWRSAWDEEAYSVLSHLPGRTAIRKVLSASRAREFDEQADRAEAALRVLEKTARTHAGSMGDLLMMIRPRDTAARASVEEEYRKLAYAGNSHIQGVQSRCQLSVHMVQLGPSSAELAIIGGRVHMRRLNPKITAILGGRSFRHDHGERFEPRSCESIDGSSPLESGGVPLLKEFSDAPEEALHTALVNGICQYRLGPGSRGETAARTYLFGEVLRQTGPLTAIGDEREASMHAGVPNPCETLLLDVVLRRDQFPDPRPRAGVFTETGGIIRSVDQKAESARLPVEVSVEFLGRPDREGNCRAYPDHSRLMRHVFSKLEWDLDLFDLYRVRLAYPPLMSDVAMTIQLPEA